jgi:hypothetical protein
MRLVAILGWSVVGLGLPLIVSLAQAQDPPALSCPKSVVGKPNWFKGFLVPSATGKLPVQVTVKPSEVDCTGLPAEMTVPNHQVVTLDVIYPTDYTCSTALAESAVTSSSPVPELIAALAKLGVISVA